MATSERVNLFIYKNVKNYNTYKTRLTFAFKKKRGDKIFAVVFLHSDTKTLNLLRLLIFISFFDSNPIFEFHKVLTFSNMYIWNFNSTVSTVMEL